MSPCERDDMGRTPAEINLTEGERKILLGWLRSGTTEKRKVERARIILMCAEGRTNRTIANVLGCRAARVSKWRTRFARRRIAGLEDEARSGRDRSYSEETERKVLEMAKSSPPRGADRWTCRLLAEKVGTLAPHQVFRILSRNGVRMGKGKSVRRRFLTR